MNPEQVLERAASELTKILDGANSTVALNPVTWQMVKIAVNTLSGMATKKELAKWSETCLQYGESHVGLERVEAFAMAYALALRNTNKT